MGLGKSLARETHNPHIFTAESAFWFGFFCLFILSDILINKLLFSRTFWSGGGVVGEQWRALSHVGSSKFGSKYSEKYGGEIVHNG